MGGWIKAHREEETLQSSEVHRGGPQGDER